MREQGSDRLICFGLDPEGLLLLWLGRHKALLARRNHGVLAVGREYVGGLLLGELVGSIIIHFELMS